MLLLKLYLLCTDVEGTQGVKHQAERLLNLILCDLGYGASSAARKDGNLEDGTIFFLLCLQSLGRCKKIILMDDNSLKPFEAIRKDCELTMKEPQNDLPLIFVFLIFVFLIFVFLIFVFILY